MTGHTRAGALRTTEATGGIGTVRRIVGTGFWISLALSLACGSSPVPLVVTQGTSFTVLLSGENLAGEGVAPALNGYLVGYGGSWFFNGASAFRDVQRGEIEFYLDQLPTLDPVDPHRLFTDFATRVFADPASDAAVESSVRAPWLDTEMGLAQVQVLVFVPCTAGIGLHTLRARRVFRNGDGSLAGFNQTGFPSGELQSILPYQEPIEIIEDPDPVDGCKGDDHRSPPLMTFGGGMPLFENEDPASTLRIYPNPKLIVWLPTYEEPDPNDLSNTLLIPPSAVHLEIPIDPALHLTVVDVIEEQHYGRRSVITWKMLDGDLIIDFVNTSNPPDVSRLGVVYHPEASYQRISTLDLDLTFPITTEVAWDPSGTQATATNAAYVGLIR